MNMWGFTPRVFDQLRERFEKFLESNASDLKAECYIPNTVGELVCSGEARVKVLHSRDSWFGVTYREDRPRVVESIRRLIADGLYPERALAMSEPGPTHTRRQASFSSAAKSWASRPTATATSTIPTS